MKSPTPPDPYQVHRTAGRIWWLHADVASAFRDAELEPFERFRETYRVSETGPEGRSPLVRMRVPEVEGTILGRHYCRGGVVRHFNRDLYAGTPRPFHEIRVSAALGEEGIPTCQVVAGRVEPVIGPVHRADLLVREVSDSRDLRAYFNAGKEAELPPEDRATVLRETGRFLAYLHRSGLLHPDLHLKNLLVTVSGDGDPHLHVIDLDRARMKSSLSPEERRKNLYRFVRSMEKCRRETGVLGEDDMLVVLEAYLGTGALTADPEPMLEEWMKRFRWHRYLW